MCEDVKTIEPIESSKPGFGHVDISTLLFLAPFMEQQLSRSKLHFQIKTTKE